MTLADDASRAQRRAADAARSVWVSASAGSGKTKVLTDRVLNLLLTGAAPDRLLCLTFTKAAAAEMSNRINERLGNWTVAAEGKLRDDIAALTGRPADADTCRTARRLFARVLDTPGGMRILTIHAFCQSILRRFPLEAEIIPNFEVMDDRSAAELQAEARNAVLVAARENPGSPLAAAFAAITASVEENGFAKLLTEIQSKRGALQSVLQETGGIDAYIDGLWRSLGLKPGTRRLDCIAAACTEAAFDAEALRRACACLLQSTSKTDRARGEVLAAWLAAPESARIDRWDEYLLQFLTTEFGFRRTLATAPVAKSNPWLIPALQAEAERIDRVRLRCAAISAAMSAAAIARFADAFLGHYAHEKRQRGVLDYDDLILATRRLLTRPGIDAWVLFKLDGGIDHILIDEAQDTSPDQWRVIEALTGDFFAGESARAANRTVFAVGDPKQSIYSFQGAEPQRFLEVGENFKQRAAAVGADFDRIPLAVSFRSTEAVLNVVDAVFAQDPAADGVVFDATPIKHSAFRGKAPGRVEHWPMLAPRAADRDAPWTQAREQKFAEAPRAQLAQRIADTIHQWITTKQLLLSQGRPIRAGDVMVLVRRRNAFVRDLIRALKARDIPVAGADRIVLTQQLAVMDLMALARFLLLPEDDLTLAALLKSPLFGLDENQLFALCHGRGRETVWSRLRRDHSGDPALAAARDTLSALLARADFIAPHALFAELLGARGGRCRLIGRLGPEASDAIDEFLNQTLAYERMHVPSLQGFIAWLEQSESDIKRDLDQGDRNEVRIMTVHGSKGLQAPIVFLPDTATMPTKLDQLLWSEEGFLFWSTGEARAAAVLAAAKQRASDARDREYRRLLYVALTRAEDRLYICGWRGKNQPTAGNWHELVDTAMQRLTDASPMIDVRDETGNRAPMVYETGDAFAEAETRKQDPAAGTVRAELPEFATRPPAREPLPPKPLAALRPAQAEPPSRSPLAPVDDERRYKRGTIIHRLLQTLPDLPVGSREAAARRYLARPALELDAAQQQETLAETLSVLSHPDFQDLFGPGSLAEVPVVGLIEGQALSGRIDRLVVTEAAVMIVDYKTNRPPSRDVATVPAAYLEQLRAYRQALAGVYPDKHVRCFLLWTVGPFILEIP